MNAQNEGHNNNANNQNPKQGGLSWSTPQNNTAKPVSAFVPPPAPKAQAPAAASAAEGGSAKIAGWLAAGIVAGVLIAWGATSLLNRDGSASVNGNIQNATSNAADTTSGGDSLVVPSPQKAGLSVTIGQTSVASPTWVVVYESRDGKPGNVLGAAIFSAEHSSGTVDLLRATIAGQTYFVTEQADNGDRRFSLKDDTLITAGGEPMWISFTAN